MTVQQMDTGFGPQDSRFLANPFIYCRRLFSYRKNILQCDKMKRTKECKWYQICPIKRYYEKGLINVEWVRDYCHGTKKCVRYIMEERGEPHPDWMMPDGTLDKNLRLTIRDF